MTLRELYEKATGVWVYDSAKHAITTSPHFSKWGPSSKEEGVVHTLICVGVNPDRAVLIVAAHNCLPELLAVREAGEEYFEKGCTAGLRRKLFAALRAFREKEGKL